MIKKVISTTYFNTNKFSRLIEVRFKNIKNLFKRRNNKKSCFRQKSQQIVRRIAKFVLVFSFPLVSGASVMVLSGILATINKAFASYDTCIISAYMKSLHHYSSQMSQSEEMNCLASICELVCFICKFYDFRDSRISNVKCS